MGPLDSKKIKANEYIKKFEDIYGWPFIHRHKVLICDLAKQVGSGSLVYENYVLFNKKYPTKNIDVFIEWWNELNPINT
jgi:hypothetical protein